MAKMRITKVYTKTGDKGSTLLVGGQKVSKASARVESYGDIDELNSVLGIVIKETEDREIIEILTEIQNDLFIMGGDLASTKDIELPRVDKAMVEKLENIIDKSVSRRAERRVVSLMQEENIGEYILPYINRLSDLFFVMARVENKRGNFKETFVRFDR